MAYHQTRTVSKRLLLLGRSAEDLFCLPALPLRYMVHLLQLFKTVTFQLCGICGFGRETYLASREVGEPRLCQHSQKNVRVHNALCAGTGWHASQFRSFVLNIFLRRLRMLDELERGVSVTLGDKFTVNNNLANVDKHAPVRTPVRSGNCGLCN